ncbi:metallophosphoesterase [Brevirhabdus pacifica]|uniref:Metallophosphoesterase n=1 Tax=Brevirhabdus pacifica TaxID=1267768 RepID=A0A1U7DHA8_9RHOB|nr:ligase-associated DNA damage response endonuclease PdeM [Brevirhabdus pacifica]APX89384.1 metallophosphoesterase [Brevirhabdus pacifica]OWU76591.1 metallophosphoesterase [Loktanella sp. 22II-4b]PJJ85981.1 putative phosphoesterase [Brevirhabdus pacifica]
MNFFAFQLAGAALRALPSGGLWWPGADLLCVSDLHLGKAERMARRGGPMLPPYEVRDTLGRLEQDLAATGAGTVICLGDSFDDLDAAHALPPAERAWLERLVAPRRWIWAEGNHDPDPVPFGGSHAAEVLRAPLVFRHIARPPGGDGAGTPDSGGALAEVSGHYHPKARVNLRSQRITRPCFLLDRKRLILPAYGTYTGGLFSHAAPLSALMDDPAVAILCGPAPCAVPMPR